MYAKISFSMRMHETLLDENVSMNAMKLYLS